MRDGSDAVADWPILNALVNTATGASWVSFHHGGGVGMGLSLHAGQVCVADGTELGGRADPAHADRRSRHGHRPPRRRGLRRGDRGRRPARGADPDAAVTALDPRRRAGPALPRGRAAVPAPRPRGELTLEPGRRRAGSSDGGADVEIDASGCAVLPGFVDCHTHLPFAGWRAEEYERKVTGVPYEEIARAGGGIAASARALAERDRRGGARPGRGRSRRELLRHGTTAFEGKTGYGLSREGEARAARLGPRAGRRASCSRCRSPACSRTRSRRAHRRRAGWTRRRRSRASATSTRSTSSSSRSPSATSTSRAWARSRATPGRPLRAHVEQLSTHALGARRAASAGARSVDHLSRHAPRRRRAARRLRDRGRAAARRRADERRAHRRRRARWPTPARSACWPPTSTPARRRSPRCR